MSNPYTPPGGDPDVASSAPVLGFCCSECQEPLHHEYFQVAQQPVCADCAARLSSHPPGGGLYRLAKATMRGSFAALLGAFIWLFIRRLTNYEIGLVAILVGYMVGKAVFKGSEERGGRGYQLLAVLLTYVGICLNYAPDIFTAIAQANAANAGAANAPAPGAAARQKHPVQQASVVELLVLAVVVFAISLAMPFLGGFDNLIGLLIIGFALWEAWKFTARAAPPVSGPFPVPAGAS